MSARDYRLYGLRLHSDLPLPELAAAQGDGVPDVHIRIGRVDEPCSPEGMMEPITEGARFAIPGVARYGMFGGHEILVEPAPGAEDRNVRLYLLGSAMGMIVHQRGMLPLHANAVNIDGQAYAFMGPSGTGKSTLAAWFHRRGYPMLADDVCVVGSSPSGARVAFPGLPRFRLWKEALSRFGDDPAHYQRSYPGEDGYDKYDVPAAGAGVSRDPVPLGGIYLLGRGDGFAIRRLAGVEAAEALIANTYRGEYVPLAKGAVAHWRASMALVQAVPIHLVQRVWQPEEMDRENALILAHARASGAPKSSG